MTFAVRASDDYRLLAVLNKGVSSVSGDTVSAIIKQNTDFSLGNITVSQFLWRNPIILIAIVALFAAVLILLMYSYLRKNREAVLHEKNDELERFIGYVCRSHASVSEVNFNTSTQIKYILRDGHIELQECPYEYTDSKTIHTNIPDDDFSNINASINTSNIGDIINQAEDKYFEYRLREKDGYHWYAVTMSPIPKDEAHPNNVLIFKRDIDEAKRKEEQAKEALQKALDAANQASKAKGDFMSRMSHEIRTPLNAVIGYMSIAQSEDIQNEKVTHCLENSELAAKHLLSIINDVLDMSSIESGRIKIANSDYNLKQQLSTVSTIFYNQAKNHDVDFEVSINGLTEEWVVGDQLRVNQILMNLLSNAVKFTPANGRVGLDITQLEKTDSKVTIQFKVQDTGIGMTQEYLSRIFKPFEQESAGTAQKFGGTGLGLAISKNLTSLMGGSIDVQSEQNKGSIFTVTLPFGISAENQPLVPEAFDFSKIRVLVVDDQEADRQYTKEILKHLGIKCDTFSDGETAVRRFIRRQNSDYAFDLCIIDWKMPNSSGLEIAKKIREAGGKDVPIIIATAYDVTEIDEQAKSAGVNKVIAKPLFQSSLLDLLLNTFGKYTPKGNSAAAAHFNLQGARVLLAEDNEMNMEIAVSILTKANLVVETAVNGKEAVDAFKSSKQGHFDAILMDVQMPIMNGYEATRAIRALERSDAKTIPIIAMTANAFTQDIEEALANGMNGHIAKPVDYEKLYRTLNDCMHKSNSQE